MTRSLFVGFADAIAAPRGSFFQSFSSLRPRESCAPDSILGEYSGESLQYPDSVHLDMNNTNEPLARLYQELLEFLTHFPDNPTNSTPPDLPVCARKDRILPDWEASRWDVLGEQDDARGETAHKIGGESAKPPQPFAKGDLSTVYRRFEQIIHDRIRNEVQHNLPHFPWEQGAAIEELDYIDDLRPLQQCWQQAWLPQLQQLLPIHIPEPTLLQLLAACNQVVGSVQPQGMKMADAAKVLFPEYGAQLNDVLNRIRLSPTLALGASRDNSEHSERMQARLAKVLPSTYQEASLEQQMAIAVLLAKSILDRLTLTLTPRQATQTAQWESTAGTINLTVATNTQGQWGDAPLSIQATLPSRGELTLTTPTETLSRTCPAAGELTLELANWEPGQTYLLNIAIQAEADSVLQFALVCQR